MKNSLHQLLTDPNELEACCSMVRKEYDITTLEDLQGALEEWKQIRAFPEKIQALRERIGGKRPLELVFHIFCDGHDYWDHDPAQALVHYLFLRTFSAQVRLYAELYMNRAYDEMEEEHCLVSYGGTPI